MHRRGAVWLAVLASCLLLPACDGRAGAEEDSADVEAEAATPVMAAGSVPSGVSADDVERGRQLFLPCAVCHSFDGRGNQLGPSLRDTTWVHIDGSLPQIEQIIRTGVPEPEEYPVPMVPMGGGDFDAAELRAVASYVYAISQPTSGSNPRETQR